MSEIVKLKLSEIHPYERIFDMVGSVLFVVYGALIGAYSNVLLNGVLILVHIVKLRRMRLNANNE